MKRARIQLHGEAVWGVVENQDIVLAQGTRVPVEEANYLPPVEPSKIIAVHLSYRSRCEEYQMAAPPATPSYFLKPPSSLSWHGAPVERPKDCQFLNYEGEIGVIIGRKCKGVSVADALSFVSGYTVANDWGVHDFRHADRGAMFRVKGQDGFCPLGPFVVDAADVDPENMTVRTYVNGTLVQEANTGRDLLFSIAYMIADVARYITLEPGDVLLTGTPANSRPVAVGDIVDVEVEGIGRLSNYVTAAETQPERVGEQPKVSDLTLHVALAIPEEEARRRTATQ